jgi:sugar phosphate isomerase/epimerase
MTNYDDLYCSSESKIQVSRTRSIPLVYRSYQFSTTDKFLSKGEMMKLGFYTNYSEEVVRFAQQVGFRCLELSAWPGSSLKADQLTDKRIAEICKDLEKHDIEISGLGFYPNWLDPDPSIRSETQSYCLKVLDLALKMNVGVLCTTGGRDPDKSVPENIPIFAEVFGRLCEEAEKRSLRIAIENCPMMDQVHMRGTNIAFSPEVWDVMFEAVPSKALGIEFDPSHMVWLGIDYVQAVYGYGNRIFHVHAKDMEIRREVLSRVGIYGELFGKTRSEMGAHGWWRARTPGWGEVNWPKFITALVEVNYNGNIDIEHEDEVFAKAATPGEIKEEADIVAGYGTEQRGLILGYNTLSRLIPPS